MKRQKVNKALGAVLSVAILIPAALPVYAETIQENNENPIEEAQDWKTGTKDHWDVDSEKSDLGECNTRIQNGGTIEESGSKILGKALKFEDGTDNYMCLDNYINTGKEEQLLQLQISSKEVTNQIDSKSIFGINHRYAFNGYGTFDSEKMEMKKEFVELYEDAGFGSIRYPGGTISNLFNWKTTLGPKESRKNQIHGFYNNPNQGGIAPNFGIGEIATFADQVDSEIVYVYSLGRGSAKDAEDLVEYLNAEVGTNPNGGVDWAKVRAENGHEEPYNVRYFEIGNEMNQGGDDGRASQQYWTSYVEGGAEKAYIDGGTAKFDTKYTVKEEDWNKVASQSDGSKNQVRYLRYANVNPGTLSENGQIIADPDFKAMEQGVRVFVGKDGDVVEWKVVKDFSKSGPDDRHCIVDYSTGAIQFGDGVHGKIPLKGNNIYATYSVKRDGFIEISKAIKETTAKINEKEKKEQEAHVYTSFESTSFAQNMKNRNAEQLYDGMTIHPYSDPVAGGNDAELFYDNAMKHAEDKGVGKVTRMMEHMPKDKVPVISEYGIFRNTEPQLRSQTHAIYIAKVIMEYVRLGSPYIQKHCLTDWYSSGADSLGPTQQAVIQVAGGTDEDRKTGEGNFTFFSTPSAHVFKMLNSGFGDQIVETKFSEIPTMKNGVKTLSSLASLDADGNVYVAIVNVDREKDRKIELNLDGIDVEGRNMKIQRLESDKITDENSPEDKNKVSVREEEMVAESNAPIIEVKKHSFVIVKLEADAPIVDKSELQGFVHAVELLNKEYYEDFSQIEEMLQKAKGVLENIKATDEDVAAALANLRAAQEALVMKNADYSKVDEAISTATKLDRREYKDFREVDKAIAAVILGKKIDEQNNVNAMAERIVKAIGALEKIESTDIGEPTEKPQNQGQEKPEKPGQIKPQSDKMVLGEKVPVTGDEGTVFLWVISLVMTGVVLTVVGKRVTKNK